MSNPKFYFTLREDIINDKRFLPTRAESKASGYDVRAAMPDKNPLVIKPFQYVKIPLGVRAFCPEGWWYEIKPRSSTFAKKHLHALYGTIDQEFEGELVFACQYIPEVNIDVANVSMFRPYGDHYKTANFPYFPEHAGIINISSKLPQLTVNFGDAVGQIIPRERQEMEVVEWSNEDYDNACKARAGTRGAGGFGSTGK